MRSTSGAASGSRQRGQAAVEFALALPLVVLVLLGIVQVAVVARDRMAVELAAREGARAAAVSAEPVTAAHLAAERVITLRPIDVDVAVGASMVTVTVTHVNDTDVAFLGRLLPPAEVTASASMALEPPDGTR